MPLTDSRAFHASLNVSDLEQSIAFYRAFLGVDPAKQRKDYAKFELNDPPLVLSLIPGRSGSGGSLNHFGLRVADSEALVAIQHRLELAGIPTKREEGVACCYAKQTKFWVPDPDRVLWEIYVLQEDIDEHGDDPVPDMADLDSGCDAAPRVTWQHQIGEPVPARIPHDDHSVHEVHLEGSANVKSPAAFCALLGEVFRVLRPGGELKLHGLSGDAPLTVELPPLPGPAAVVEHVPSHASVVEAVLAAGFFGVHLEQFSSTAHFTVDGVAMRELRLTARKPGHRPKAATHHAVYLGPLAQVTDDFGTVFKRGEPTPLNIHDWQALSKGPVAEQFLLL